MVWRRVLLRSDQTVTDLHYGIQIAMGWSDAHLNRFHIHGKDYGVPHDGGIYFDDNPNKVRLADFRFRLRERFLYEYDFYDRWQHDVRLEKMLPCRDQLYPLCTGGQRLAPPEDCGGARAFTEQGDPRMREWLYGWPQKDWNLLVQTMQRLRTADADDEIATVIPDRPGVRKALKRIQAHQAARPDRIARRERTERLRQYARGERDWLFCEILGG